MPAFTSCLFTVHVILLRQTLYRQYSKLSMKHTLRCSAPSNQMKPPSTNCTANSSPELSRRPTDTAGMANNSILDRLPPEMIKAVADEVDALDVLAFKLVCKTFNVCRKESIPSIMQREYPDYAKRATIIAQYSVERMLAPERKLTTFICTDGGHLQDRCCFADADFRWPILSGTSGLSVSRSRTCLPCQAKWGTIGGPVKIHGVTKSICHSCYTILPLDDRVTFNTQASFEVYGDHSGDWCTSCVDKESLTYRRMHDEPGYICELIATVTA